MSQHSFFLLCHKWARDIDTEITIMLRDKRFYCVDLFPAADVFRYECIETVSRKYRGEESAYGKRDLAGYYIDRRKVYVLFASIAYKKLLYAPFKLYSALGTTQRRTYLEIFNCAFDKLIEMAVYREEDRSKALAQLESVEELCSSLQRNGKFMEW
jgi:hypothetical protein